MIFGIGELQRSIENDRRRIHELETALLKAEQERDKYKEAWDWVKKFYARYNYDELSQKLSPDLFIELHAILTKTL